MLQPYNGSGLTGVEREEYFGGFHKRWRCIIIWFVHFFIFEHIYGHCIPFTSVYQAVCCCTFSLCFKANPWKRSIPPRIASHSLLNHFNPQGAQTLAVISSASASAWAQNKTSVAWISFCGRMSCLGEQWVWRARRHGPPSECLPSTQQPYSERTTHLGLRGDFNPACVFWALAPFWTLFAVRPIVLEAFFAPQHPAVKLPFLKYSVKGWNGMSVHVERCPNQMNWR